MTEHETPAAGTAAPADDADQPAADKAPPPARRGRGFQWILLLLLLGLAGAGAYWVEVIHRAMLDTVARRLSAVEQGSDALFARLDSSESALSATAGQAADATTRVTAVESAQAQLGESVNALYARESQTNLDWVLAEAEYLVFAATQRLALEEDAATAAVALKAADERLRSAEHPDLIELRSQLARDMAALEAVDKPDIEGLALYLADTVTRVDKLPTRPIAQLDMSFSQTTGEVAADHGWRELARSLWADVRNLVEIKDGELEDGVLFDPQLRYFLQQNLRLELASARLAVLQRDTVNFRAATKLVTDLLDTYYDTDAGEVRAITRRLAKAQTIELSPAVPDISGSLDAVRARRREIRDAAVAGRL